MGGKGETVKFTRLFAKTAKQRAVLKKKINAIINEATHNLTIEAMVESLPASKKMARRKRRT